MNIIQSKKLMRQGVTAQMKADLEFPREKFVRMEETTILLVSKGHALLEVNFITYELTTNSIITIVPKSTIRCVEASEDFQGSCFSFDRDFALEAIPRLEPDYMDFLRNYPLGSIPEHRAVPIHAGIGNVAYFLYESEGAHRMQIAKNIIQGILLEIYDVVKTKFLGNKPKVISRQNELFMRFIHLVNKYGDKEREVTFYADKLCITTRYLASILRNIAHETPKEIIDRHCIQEIKTLLRTTNDTLQSISLQLNFPDQSFFTRYFKKQTGMTPKAFRAKEE